ncbi:MAG: hypothetical protein M1834_006303 [Cirrosporium novae-zelandiae]|nr:MAG: hypothetical protein M1834_006303 [Cirrosporium novae-zelandiae]
MGHKRVPTHDSIHDHDDSLRHSTHTEPDLARVDSGHIFVAMSFSRGREIAFVFIICMAQLMTQAAFTQSLAPLHIIGDDLGTTNPGILSWYIASYSLTVGTFILVMGRFGDLFGYKKMFVLGFIWFGVWSAVVGLAAYSNQYLFIVARAVQGIGPAMLMPNGLAILGSSYPPGERKHMVFALFGAVAPTGAILGMVFSALFSDLTWWPWTFWSCAIVCIVFAALGAIIIPPPPNNASQHESWAEKVRDMDILGCLTGVISLVLINIAWNQGPVVGWGTPYVYVLLIVGFLFLGLFMYFELRLAHAPLLPPEVFTPTVGYVLACVACGWATFGIWVFYLVQFIQQIRGYNALSSALQLVPASPAGLCASIMTGLLMSKIRPAWIMAIALAAFLTATLLIGTAPAEQIYWGQTFVSLLVGPFGMDMSFPASTVILSDAVGKKNQGVAASLVATVVNYSISIGLGFAGTVEVHVNEGGVGKHNLLKGYRGAWYMGVGFSGLGLCLAILFVIKTYMADRRPKPSTTPYEEMLDYKRKEGGTGLTTMAPSSRVSTFYTSGNVSRAEIVEPFSPMV